MAAQALMLVEDSAAIQVEIENELEARDKADAAWMVLDDEVETIRANAAKQFALQSSGKPVVDTDAALAQFKESKAKLDGVEAKKEALNFLLDALEARLEQLQADARDDYVAVLKRKINEQEKAFEMSEDGAEKAKELLDRLNQELATLVPAAAPAAGEAPPGPAGAGGAAPVAPAPPGAAAGSAPTVPPTAGAATSPTGTGRSKLP
jgi:hypothetical protein